ncbi:MAG: hypothetical protein RXQ77_01465 [Candidatus Nanopusillus sp.]
MRGKIFDDFMMFIGYFLPIFIIIIGGVIFILTSIFKYYHINNPSQYYMSIQNQNIQNNQNSGNNNIDSTIMVNIYYQNQYNIYYVPSFNENLSNWSIYYNITNVYSGVNSGSNLLQINSSNITNINSTSFDINSLSNVELESIINLSNNTLEGNNVIYTYQGNTYNCSIVGSNTEQYWAGNFVYFCILCESSQNMSNFYLNESIYINITPAISLLDENQYPNSQYYNYTVNNIEIVNGTYLAIPLSNNGGYSMEDFQNILVTIGYPLDQYINTTPYVGDNVVFLLNYDGKYYALPSWYAGESNGNYYFFINLLNIPSLYNSNFGCNIISIFVGFSNETLLPYLNGTIGGDPYALDPTNSSSAVIYDNGLNVFPIYVNFYPYPDSGGAYSIEDNQSCSNSNGYLICYQNYPYYEYYNVLPPYNNVSIYLNGTGVNIEIVDNGPLQGLLMDDGTTQGSYALITSTVLQNTFNQLVSPQSQEYQNGLGLQTFAYFSGIPWEDSTDVSDAVVLSYVTDNNQFTIDTVKSYNALNQENNTVCIRGCHPIGNKNIGINVGGYNYLPLNFPIFMYEYGWARGGPGPGFSSGYYAGILQYNSTKGLGYFLTTQYNTNPCSSNLCTSGYYDYYYSGSADGGSKYYFLEDNTSNIKGYNGGSNYSAFMPPDQQINKKDYYQYGVFWLYNWFRAENNNENSMNIFFLMNGNIFNYSLASEQYNWNCVVWCDIAYAIPPNPPANTINGEPIFTQSYINAYNTAFNQNQETSGFTSNYQKALNNYYRFTYGNVNSDFIPGTFGYDEEYYNNGEKFRVHHLVDSATVYIRTPYLFVSAGSGGGSGFMYLDWIIVTYGVPYVVSVS